jgi:uncharacterized protein (TIGR04255 family)
MGSENEMLYPNQPLVEVVFELQFPGELVIECQRHTFWNRIREGYPLVFVPSAKPDRPLALEPYRFQRDGDNQSPGIALAMHRFAMYVRRYEGYPVFRAEFLRLLDEFQSVFALERLTRAGWRYVNVIPFVRDAGVIPLQRFLKLDVHMPGPGRQFTSLDLSFESRETSGSVTTRLKSVRAESGQEALLLDFDFGRLGDDLRFSEVGQYMEEAHGYTRGLFESLITDDYRAYLEGDVL